MQNWDDTQTQQQRPESPSVTLACHASKCKVRKPPPEVQPPKVYKQHTAEGRRRSTIFFEWTRNRPASIRRTSELFLRQHHGNAKATHRNLWETGWTACGLFRAHRYHLELNWTEQIKRINSTRHNYATLITIGTQRVGFSERLDTILNRIEQNR